MALALPTQAALRFIPLIKRPYQSDNAIPAFFHGIDSRLRVAGAGRASDGGLIKLAMP